MNSTSFQPISEAAAAEHVEARGPLYHQHRLSLRQDKHLRRKADPRRAAAQKFEQDEAVADKMHNSITLALGGYIP